MNTSPCKGRPKPPSKTLGSSSSRQTVKDPYYGHEETAKLCAHFVTHLFVCPELPPPSTAVPLAPSPPLANFIAYALHRTRLHSSVTFAALYLLRCLRARFPTARGPSGHRLFISAFMVAAKMIYDDIYSNKSWTVVSLGMFPLREINQMEREMCSYLGWQLNIEPNALKEFETKVRRDFDGPGPYPNYVLPLPLSSLPTSTMLHNVQIGPRNSQQPPSDSSTVLVDEGASSRPRTPDTPELSISTSTCSALGAAPSTPAGYEDHSVRVVESETMGRPTNINSQTRAYSQTGMTVSAPRTGRIVSIPPTVSEIYACATYCVW